MDAEKREKREFYIPKNEREKQFDRQIEINAEIKKLKLEMEDIK